MPKQTSRNRSKRGLGPVTGNSPAKKGKGQRPMPQPSPAAADEIPQATASAAPTTAAQSPAPLLDHQAFLAQLAAYLPQLASPATAAARSPNEPPPTPLGRLFEENDSGAQEDGPASAPPPDDEPEELSIEDRIREARELGRKEGKAAAAALSTEAAAISATGALERSSAHRTPGESFKVAIACEAVKIAQGGGMEMKDMFPTAASFGRKATGLIFKQDRAFVGAINLLLGAVAAAAAGQMNPMVMNAALKTVSLIAEWKCAIAMTNGTASGVKEEFTNILQSINDILIGNEDTIAEALDTLTNRCSADQVITRAHAEQLAAEQRASARAKSTHRGPPKGRYDRRYDERASHDRDREPSQQARYDDNPANRRERSRAEDNKNGQPRGNYRS